MDIVLAIAALWVVLIAVYFVWPFIRNRLTPRPRISRALDSGLVDYDSAQLYNDRVAAATAVLESPPGRRVALPMPASPTTTPVAPPLRPQVVTPTPVVPSSETAMAHVSQPAVAAEVDLLRAQVQQLRHELVALSTAPAYERYERPRLRRYRTGSYTYLPRELRRQVLEVRSSRSRN